MNNYSEELRSILKQSELLALENNNKEVNTLHFLISVLKTSNSCTNILLSNNISVKTLLPYLTKENDKISYIFYSKEFLEVIESIILEMDDLTLEITLPTTLLNILENKKTLCYKILKELNINTNNLIKSLKTKEITNLNLTIKELATDLTEAAKNNELDKVIGRDKEIERIIEILARKNKNNPILIGEAGTGKTAIVEELARRISLDEVPDFLKGKTILNLNLASLIAGTKYRGEFEEKLTKIIKELESVDNIILFIDEVHTLVGAGGAEGAIDASNILKPSLARGKIRIIGATTFAEYKQSIETDKALDRRFQKVLVHEPNKEETKEIIKKIKKDYETYHNVKLNNNIINKIVDLSTLYIKDRHEPDKSIDLLDEVCARANVLNNKNFQTDYNKKIQKLKTQKLNYLKQEDYYNATRIKNEIDSLLKKENNNTILKRNTVSQKILKKVLENKCMNPIYELEDKTYLSNLNNNLMVEFPKYKKQINDLVDITHNIFSNITQKPTSVFIKSDNNNLITKYAKILKLNTITIDGNEYSNIISMSKLIGSPAGYVGYNEKNTTLEKIKRYPRSIIIVNNYELINTQIQNTIENILKTGKLKLANNETLDFSSSIFFIIDSSNEKTLGFIPQTLSNITKSFDYYINLEEKNAILN